MMIEEHRQLHPNLNYNVVEILRREELGVGSYGAVYRAKCDELLCAAKVLHPILYAEGDDTAGEARLVRQFDQECHFLKDLRHPNIVQYLGMYIAEGNVRVLLMELMDGNLTRFLEQNERNPLPYHRAIDISNDVALALAYLHSNYIVHRDLSSNNVLLMGERRAKVSDFGVSKLISPHRQRQSSLTLCPGNSAYMPPEAIDEAYTASYSEKLDCFSYGVLCIQILTRKFPAPTARLVAADGAHMMMRAVVAEVECRREHIDTIDDDHPLRGTILQCLSDAAEDRPSAQEICHRLARLKDGPRYTESIQEGNARPTTPRRDDEEVLERRRREEEIRDLQHQLGQTRDERDQLRQQMRRSRAEVTRKNREIEEKARRIAQLERERLHHSQQIVELTAGMQEAQQQLHRSEQQLQTDIVGLEQRVSEQDLTIRSRDTEISELQERLRRAEQVIQQQVAQSERISRLRITSRYGGEAICPMRREPDATAFRNVVYFKYFWGKHIVSYNTESKKWSELPPCPNSSFSMAVIDGLLTIIGGKTPNIDPTNALLSFTNDSEWNEQYPPMPTKRYWTIAVSYSGSIIVLGGEAERRNVVCTVEVFDIKSRVWFAACSLPQPFDSATATVCSGELFLACGSSENTARCVLSCSVSQLLDSCHPIESAHAIQEPGMWNRVSNLPFHKMTITNLGDYVLAVGGKKKNGAPSSAVYVYDRVTATWIEIGYLELPRSSCFAVSLSRDEVMVVGGLVDDDGKEATNSVEFLVMN